MALATRGQQISLSAEFASKPSLGHLRASAASLAVPLNFEHSPGSCAAYHQHRDCGWVVSPRTARSQVQGGVVWGIGAATREGSEVDRRFGGFLNADIAEYVVPVNADIGSIEVGFIDKPDPLFTASASNPSARSQ